VARQRSTVGAGAIHPDAVQRTEPSGTGEQLPLSPGGRREAVGGEQSTQRGEDSGDVGVFVCAHPHHDFVGIGGFRLGMLDEVVCLLTARERIGRRRVGGAVRTATVPCYLVRPPMEPRLAEPTATSTIPVPGRQLIRQ
jgi:hypothetical protein